MPAMKLESCTFALFGALGDLALRKIKESLSASRYPADEEPL